MLARGGLVAYPTEAVYGIGCDPLSFPAVQRLLQLKGRQAGKGLILIASDLSQLRPYLTLPPEPQLAPVLASWPGPNTWIMPAAPDLPGWLSGGRDTVAVRVTAHPLAAMLCRAWGGPLVSTSANPSGHRPARSALAVRRLLPSGLDLVLHGAVGGDRRPTRIRHALSGATLRG